MFKELFTEAKKITAKDIKAYVKHFGSKYSKIDNMVMLKNGAEINPTQDREKFIELVKNSKLFATGQIEIDDSSPYISITIKK